MTLSEILGTGGITLIAVLAIVEIAPIEINPWSKIARCIGRALNVEVMEKIELDEAVTARYRIIAFDDELRHSDTKHSEERFGQIIDDIDVYERYCREHPKFANNKAVRATKNIMRVYEDCCKENSFV